MGNASRSPLSTARPGFTAHADAVCERLSVTPRALAALAADGLVQVYLPMQWGRAPRFADVLVRDADVALLVGTAEVAAYRERFGPAGPNTERPMALGAIMTQLGI